MGERKLSGDEILQAIFAVYATGLSAGITRTDYDKMRDAVLNNEWLKNNGKIVGAESFSEFSKHGSVDFRLAVNDSDPVVFRSSHFIPLFVYDDHGELRADAAHRIYDNRLDTVRYDSQIPYKVILVLARNLFSVRIKAGGIECIDALRSALGDDGYAAAMKFNIIKYLWRSDHKNGAEDINKALYYLLELMYLIPDGKERIEKTVKTVARKRAK